VQLQRAAVDVEDDDFGEHRLDAAEVRGEVRAEIGNAFRAQGIDGRDQRTPVLLPDRYRGGFVDGAEAQFAGAQRALCLLARGNVGNGEKAHRFAVRLAHGGAVVAEDALPLGIDALQPQLQLLQGLAAEQARQRPLFVRQRFAVQRGEAEDRGEFRQPAQVLLFAVEIVHAQGCAVPVQQPAVGSGDDQTFRHVFDDGVERRLLGTFGGVEPQRCARGRAALDVGIRRCLLTIRACPRHCAVPVERCPASRLYSGRRGPDSMPVVGCSCCDASRRKRKRKAVVVCSPRAAAATRRGPPCSRPALQCGAICLARTQPPP
jgi:hypothetical protein